MTLNFPSSPTNGQVFGSFTYDSSLPGWRSTPDLASGMPAGTIVQWPGATAPANWLICDGSAVSRSTYASLFSAIGTTYGVGDGSTTFNLPNLKGRVPVGRDLGQTEFDALGETGGAKTHTLSISEMPAHSHSQTHVYYQPNLNALSGLYPVAAGLTAQQSGLTVISTDSNGSGTAHNNLQPYIVLNYIIKASAGITAGDSELATRVGVIETSDATTNRSGLVPVVPTSVIPVSGTATVSGVGLVSYTNCTVVELREVFTSAYTHYEIVISGTKSGTSGAHYTWARLATTSAVQTSGYQAGFNAIESGFTATTNVYATDLIPFVYSNLTGNPYATNLTMYNPAVATLTTFQHTSMGYAPGNARQHSAGGGIHNSASAYSSLQLGVTGGLLSGTIQVFGYR